MAALNMFHSLVIAAVLVYAGNRVQCELLCLTGDFDSQLQHILTKQMLPSAQDAALIISRVSDDVLATLNQRWQGFKAIPFGSLITGLVSPSSDVDFYIQLPNFNSLASSYVLQELYELFEKQPELYTHLQCFDQSNFSAFQFYHIPAQRKVDLMLEFGKMAAANSNLLRYYFNLDKRFLPLAKFLKFWFQIQRLNGHRRPRDYVLYLFIIFYLQQKNMAPPVYLLQTHSKSHFVDGWDVGFDELPYCTTNTENLHQLLGGFFKFYSDFNFEEYIIAPYAGRPIKKSAFRNIKNFPREYTLYNNKMKHKLQRRIKNEFDVSTAACVQDPFIHSLNEMERLVRRQQTKAFQYFMKRVATIYEVLPSDEILRAILLMDRPKQTDRFYHIFVRHFCVDL